jgi:hypothetical protein
MRLKAAIFTAIVLSVIVASPAVLRGQAILERDRTFSVTVGTMPEMLSAGKYAYVNPDITAEHFRFAAYGPEPVTVELVHFTRWMSTYDILRLFASEGWKPADLAILLTVKAKYPDFDPKYTVVALGSVWQDELGMAQSPCLEVYGSRLVLRGASNGFDKDTYYLAIHR